MSLPIFYVRNIHTDACVEPLKNATSNAGHIVQQWSGCMYVHTIRMEIVVILPASHFSPYTRPYPNYLSRGQGSNL